MSCLSNLKFTMFATIQRNHQSNVIDSNTGEYQEIYDELTGEVRSVWVAADLIIDNDDSTTLQIPCLVTANYNVSTENGVAYNGTRVLDNETLTMNFPTRYHLYTTDQVVSINNRLGELIYEDDQSPFTENDNNQTPKQRPAKYNITGVVPVLDPFGNVTERQANLKKAN